jgi:coronin-1B/1C/6
MGYAVHRWCSLLFRASVSCVSLPLRRFVRASLYRHVHGTPAKPEGEFCELKPACTGEGNYIAANSKFFCYAGIGGGGPVVVIPLNKPGRLPHNVPALTVHKDSVLDFEFNPFADNLLATGGEDCHLKVSLIPDDGIKANITEHAAHMEGHERKINVIHWNPAASNILASASADLTLKIWDVERQTCLSSFADFTDVCQSFDWSQDGAMLTTTCKDTFIRVYDPRQAASVIKFAGFTGSKSSRGLWRGDKGQVIAVGSSKQSARQYGMWDLKMPEKPLTLVDIDTSAGVLIPKYDHDNGVLYVAGKGDGNIRYFEIVDTDPYVHFLSEFRDNQSQKGICWLPKRAVDTTKCEVAVALRLMKDKVVPISFQVPRKSADTFQKDLYPDSFVGEPALTAAAWAKGGAATPAKRSMKPGEGGSSGAAAPVALVLKVQKSAPELQRELDAANAKIASLEAELAKLRA